MEQTVLPGALKYVLLSGVETLAFVAVLVVGLRRLHDGASARLGIVAGLIGALSSGVFVVVWAQIEWSASFELLDRMNRNALLQHTDWAQAIAVALLAAAFIARPRTG